MSILWARADAAGQAKILAAIDKAVAVGMDYIGEQAAWVGRGKYHRRAQGLVAADYVHATSRALDPQVHHHVVVANMAESPAGNVMALDGRPFFAHAKTAGYLAAAELRHELASTMGVAWEAVERGLADVAGVSEAAIAEMSKRSNEIDSYTEAMASTRWPPARWPPSRPGRPRTTQLIPRPCARRGSAASTRPASTHVRPPRATAARPRPCW